MSHFNNISRKTCMLCVLLMFMLLVQMTEAKHVIIIYDVSGSMVSLKINGKTNRYMETDDIKRVNEYLTDLLFTNTAQSLRDNDDSIIKKCDEAYDGKPLYQSGDTITFAKYAKEGNTTIDKKQVSRDEFKRHLPTEFTGQVSYLRRAKVEVYDVLYNDTDDETHWVFITDYDPDNSGKSDPGISEVLTREEKIEDEFYSPMLFQMLVNKHVHIEVRKIQISAKINTIFLATPTKPGKPVNKIQLDRNNDNKYISETLTVETHNSDKSKFKLNSVNVEIVDKFNKPLQTITDEGVSDVIKVPPVSLNNKPPPCEFRIPFPSHSEISAPENALKLEVTYKFNGENETYTPDPIPYTAFIDSIFVSVQDMPKQQAKELNLNFSDDTFRIDLLVQSESYNKEAFKIYRIRSHIQYRDGRKLSNVAVTNVIDRLGEPFSIEVPRHGHLDWFGNKVVLDIDYKYDNEAKTETIEIPYNLIGGSSGFPMWLLIIPLVILCCGIVYLFIKIILRMIVHPKVEHQIMLTQYGALGELMTDMEKTETLTANNSLAFGEYNEHKLKFDIGWSDCPDFLRCEKYSLLPWSKDKGRIRHYKSDEDPKGEIVNPTTTLKIKKDDETVEVLIQYVKEDITNTAKTDHKVVEGPAETANPLDV